MGCFEILSFSYNVDVTQVYIAGDDDLVPSCSGGLSEQMNNIL
jgi:hypothetical protein